jgi:ribonuclease P protein component
MAARGETPSIRRVRTAAEFERLLRRRPCVISAHFSVHHLGAARGTGSQLASRPVVPELSTEAGAETVSFVDDSVREPSSPRLALGIVVPKRFARRAVTRTLIKRELRAAWRRGAPVLDAGAWLVRLRAVFDASRFRSAASSALRTAVRLEVEQVVERCAATSTASSAS